MLRIMVTGAAGFMGMHIARRLLERGDEVVGIDNLNEYYDPSLKASRLHELSGFPNFEFVKLDIANRADLAEQFARIAPERVAHLAAQPGVRYSLDHPDVYIDSNLV